MLTVASTDQLGSGTRNGGCPSPPVGAVMPRLWKMFRPPLVAMAAYMGNRNVAPLPW